MTLHGCVRGLGGGGCGGIWDDPDGQASGDACHAPGGGDKSLMPRLLRLCEARRKGLMVGELRDPRLHRANQREKIE